jgi:hypothetical protein
MIARTLKLLASTAALAAILALAAVPSAEAVTASKGKKRVAAPAAVAAKAVPRRAASVRHRGTQLVPAGPLYHAREYLGDDPDPRIRFELMRDISGRYGGDE